MIGIESERKVAHGKEQDNPTNKMQGEIMNISSGDEDDKEG